MTPARIEKIARECGLYFNYCDKSGKPAPPPDNVVVKFAKAILKEAANECDARSIIDLLEEKP